MKTFTSAILMFAVAISNAFATAQYPDKVVYEGETYSLDTNPMEPYFAKHPDKKPKRLVMSTALWRGYVATFEFKTTALVLKDIEIQIWEETEDGKRDISWKSVKDDIVRKDEVLLVDWFTGILVLPHGKLLNNVHMGYGSTYSDYILLAVKQGKFTDKITYDHVRYEKFKERQFQAYKKTNAYKKQVAKLRKNGESEEFLDSFLRSFVVNYTSEFLDKEESSNKSDAGDGK